MMQIKHMGYSGQYSTELVRGHARNVAEHILQLLRNCDAQAVVVTGHSGSSIAHAALMLVEFPLVMVRKATDLESSHGELIEGPQGFSFNRYVFLDDFVATGRTLEYVNDVLSDKGCTMACALMYREHTPISRAYLNYSGTVNIVGIGGMWL